MKSNKNEFVRIKDEPVSRFSPAHPLYRAGMERNAWYARLHAEEEQVRQRAADALYDKLFTPNPYGPK